MMEEEEEKEKSRSVPTKKKLIHPFFWAALPLSARYGHL